MVIHHKILKKPNETLHAFVGLVISIIIAIPTFVSSCYSVLWADDISMGYKILGLREKKSVLSVAIQNCLDFYVNNSGAYFAIFME